MGGGARFLKEEVSLAFCFLLLVPDGQSIAIPSQDLDAVAAAIEEQEQVTREQFHIEVLTDQTAQPVETLTHVGGPGEDKDASL